jgi:hypothetical protein
VRETCQPNVRDFRLEGINHVELRIFREFSTVIEEVHWISKESKTSHKYKGFSDIRGTIFHGGQRDYI